MESYENIRDRLNELNSKVHDYRASYSIFEGQPNNIFTSSLKLSTGKKNDKIDFKIHLKKLIEDRLDAYNAEDSDKIFLLNTAPSAYLRSTTFMANSNISHTLNNYYDSLLAIDEPLKAHLDFYHYTTTISRTDAPPEPTDTIEEEKEEAIQDKRCDVEPYTHKIELT